MTEETAAALQCSAAHLHLRTGSRRAIVSGSLLLATVPLPSASRAASEASACLVAVSP